MSLKSKKEIMGTNFYWMESYAPGRSEDSIFRHIGKRSGIGGYCFACGISKYQSTSDIHSGNLHRGHLVCPGCGEEFRRSSCSFTWTMFKHRDLILDQEQDVPCILDEYGSPYTAREFRKEIFTLPLHFLNSGDGWS